jgi:hypothetical protein
MLVLYSVDHQLPIRPNCKSSMTMFIRYIEEARQTIFHAKHQADRFGALEIEPEHILLALLKDQVLISRTMEGFLKQNSGNNRRLPRSPRAKHAAARPAIEQGSAQGAGFGRRRSRQAWSS